ncbi:hypothetical protein BGZ95_002475 [Linnemannia exigua]|uniref:TRF2/HOY1 PH-like domain-containing protein n=1 Tax=Linnemannia exigua TaxID=604196 RepID=A0AAD4D5G7_9FUNG|nr:hypothetical protein BGZ95_002475 [Linnemannia exigua]
MKAQYLSNCAAAGIPPQPLYAFNAPAAGGVKPFMGGHLHPAALARAPLARANSYDAARSSAVQARMAQTGLGINVPGAGGPGLWNGQPPFGIQQPGHPGFAFRPNVPQAMGAAARGVKRSFDGANGPLSAGAVPKPLHFPGAVGADGLPEGMASSDMMFAAGMVPTASQIPTMPTFNCDNLAIGTWRRMSTSNTDLSCFYCPNTRIMTWQIIDHAARFKMTFPLSSISRIEYYEVDPMYSQVDFDLIEIPQFFMETVSEDQQRDWKKCSDFTEAKQATLVTRHTIHGLSSALKMQVMSLTIAYPPLQAITQYRETHFSAQFHAYTAPIPQIAQFVDPNQFDRRFVNPLTAGSFLSMGNDGLDSGGESSDIGEDLYDGGFGTQFTSTTSALLDLGADGIQHPRLKSRRTASMPTPAITNFLTTGLNSVPSEVSQTPTTTVPAPTTEGTTAVSSTATTTPATMAETLGANMESLTTGVVTPSTLTSAPIGTTLAPSMIATASTMPKVTITTLSDSAENGGSGTESTTVVHSDDEQEKGNKDGTTSQNELGTETKENENPMGLTSQFNEFLAQAVVSTSAQMNASFIPAGFPPGMMYGGAGQVHGGHGFQLTLSEDGSDAGYEFNSGYYGMMPEQASFVSMSDLEGQQTDGEDSTFGGY